MAAPEPDRLDLAPMKMEMMEDISVPSDETMFLDSGMEGDERKKGDEKERAVCQEEEIKLKWFHRMPYGNLVFDVLFDTVPTFEMVEKAWNLLGLVDALMLAVVLTLPATFSFDDYLAADRRLSEGTYGEYFKSENEFTFTENFNYHISSSAFFLEASLLSVVLCYFTAAFQELYPLTMKTWWFWMRWCLLGQFLLTAYGIVAANRAYMFLIQGLMPDDYVEEHGDSKFGSRHSPYGLNYAMATIVTWAAVVFTLTMASMSSLSIYRLQAGKKYLLPCLPKFGEKRMFAGNEFTTHKECRMQGQPTARISKLPTQVDCTISDGTPLASPKFSSQSTYKNRAGDILRREDDNRK